MRKLGRKSDNRKHLIENLASSLVLYEVIETTEAKAKEAKRHLERLIARNKALDLPARRRILASFFDKNAAKKMIEVLIPRYQDKASGFIRTFRLKSRLGDNAEMMRLELIDKKVFAPEEKPTKSKTDKLVKEEVSKSPKKVKKDDK